MTISVEAIHDLFPMEGIAPASGTQLSEGNAVHDDGTNWVLADADTPATLFCEGIVVRPGLGGEVSGGKLAVVRNCILYDSAAGYTRNGTLYLSGTAGALTHTRPTAAGRLRQVVGRAFSTSRARIEVKLPYEVMAPIYLKGATSAAAALDSGNFFGPTLDAATELAYMQAEIPDNAIAVAYANLWLAVEATSDTPLFAITVASAVGADQWDDVTVDSTLTASSPEGTNADEIVKLDFATALDATNIFRPGAVLGIKITSSDAGTIVRHTLGGQIVCRVV